MPRRILLAVIATVPSVAAAVLTPTAALAATGCVPTTGSTGYTVTVCLTAPVDGAVLTGKTTVTATATITGGASTLRVSGVTFCVDSAPCSSGPAYVLKDFSGDSTGAFTFSLDTALFADRTATLYAYAEMNDGLVSQPSSETVTFQNGQSSPLPVPTGFAVRSGTSAGAGGLVVAAVGDGGDGRTAEQGVANLISGWNPNMFLYLGDVYEKGSPSEFSNWYANSYGRFDSIANPTVGNHEYSFNNTAEGYQRYWSTPPHYYSYDAGGWHFVSLDSTDKFNRTAPGGQTQPGTGGVSTMYDWLAADLSAHSSACTVVYYHEPLWNQGEESPTTRMAAIWSLLAQQHVSLVLNGHDHDYQRFPAVDGTGNPSPTGVTEIISGGGGHGTQSVTLNRNPGPNPVAYGSIAGALKLTLHPDRADFVTSAVSGSMVTQIDSGSVPCQGAGTDTTAPTAPVLAAPQASFTSAGPSVALSWTASTDDRGVAGYRVRRDGLVVSGDLPASALAYTDTSVQPSTQYTYAVEAFDSFGNATLSNTQSATTPAAAQVVIQAPAADTYAAANSPTQKGTATTVKVSSAAATAGEQITYLKFNVTGTSGIGSATLRLYGQSTTSTTAPAVYAVPDNTWTETGLTWTNRPAIGGAASAPPPKGVTTGAWQSWNVTDLVAGNGTVSFALQQPATSSTAVSFASKENSAGAFAPQLVIDPPAAGTAPSVPTGLTATAPDVHTVRLAWQPSTGAVDHYVVSRDGAVVGSAPPVSAPSYTDSTVVPSTTYSYTVAAVDAAGNSSAQSAAAQVTTPDPDTTPPTVTSVTPGDGATGVAVATNVTATFSEAMDPATMTGQSFVLKDSGGTTVPGSVTYDSASRTATLDPGADLLTRTTYTATITGGVTDAAGNAPAGDYSWSFGTVVPPAPTSSFTASPTSGTAPLPVQFTDTSTGSPTSWAWDLGDGTTSALQNPAHTYTAAGTYTVTLTAGNATGPGAAATGTVTVAPPAPTASFTASPTSGRAPLPVQFTDTSTNAPTSWSWDFGDGATSTAQSPAHTYVTPGTYTVTHTATNVTGTSAPVTSTVTATGVKAGASTVATGNGSSVAVPRPARVATGDVLVMEATADLNPSVSAAPTGWAPIPSTPLTLGTASRVFAYYHVVGNAAAEPATYTWQLSAKLKWGAALTAFSGVSTATPLETATATQVSTNAARSLTVPGVNTTGTGAMLVGALGLDNPGTAATPPAGWTVAADSASTQRAVLAYRYLGSPGASGNLTWSLTKAAPSGGWLLALHAAG